MLLTRSFRIVVRAVQQFTAHRGSQMGAALAYYMLFSVAPLLLIVIFLAGLFLGEQEASQAIYKSIGEALGRDTAHTVRALVDNTEQPRAGFWAPVVAAVVLCFTALQAFLNLRTSLCAVWDLTEPPRGNALLGVLLNYALAVLMVFVLAVLVLASVWTSTVLSLALQYMPEQLASFGVHWQTLEFLVSFLYYNLLFIILYRVMSARQIHIRYMIYGGAITALLFTVGKTLIGLHFAYANLTSTWGAATSLVVFMMWIYYSAQIVIFGAELIQARRTRSEWLK